MPIEHVIVTSEQPTGRELTVELAALRVWITSELHRLDERFVATKTAQDEKFELIERNTATRFADQADNVRIALNAQKELNATVAESSDKAIQKAEDAQKGVNERGNEFRAQLKDQNDTMIPRIEAENAFKNANERIDRSFKALTDNLAAIDVGLRKNQEDLRTDIIALREYNSRIEGRQQQQTKGSTDNRWLVGTVIGLAALGMSVLASGIFSRPVAPSVVYQQESNSGGARPGGSITDTRSTTTPK